MDNRVVRGASVGLATVAIGIAAVAAAQAPSRLIVRNPSNTSHEFFGARATGLGSTLAISAAGRSIFGHVPDAPPGRVDILDAASGTLIRSIENPTPAPGDGFGVALTNVGGDLLVGAPYDDTAANNAGAAYLFDATTGALIRTYTLPGAVADQHCGHSLATHGADILLGCQGDAIYRLDVTTGAILQTYDVPNSIGFPFGVASIGGDVLGWVPLGGVSRFDGATGALIRTYFPLLGEHTVGVDVLGSDILLATGNEQGVHLFNGGTGALIHTFTEPPATWASEYFGAGLAVNGDRIAIGARGAVYFFDTTTYALVDTMLPIATYTVGQHVSAHTTGFVVQDWPPGAVATGGAQILDVCGNAFVANTESCDDGNRIDGDGCSSRCRLETCGAAPAVGCATTTAGRSKLEMFEEYSLYGEKDRIKWRWRGTGGTPADFGDPTTSSATTFCLWDRGNTVPRLRLHLDAPPGRTCSGKPCWDARGVSGFRRTDPTRNPDGLGSVTMRATSSTSLGLLGDGPTLGLPVPSYDGPFPFQGTVVAQLVNVETGACWEARYPVPSTNDHRRYRATNG